jgi:hypothetical protein
MTQNAARLATRYVTLEYVQVGAANCRFDYFDDRIRWRPDFRFWTIFKGFLARTLINESLHCLRVCEFGDSCRRRHRIDVHCRSPSRVSCLMAHAIVGGEPRSTGRVFSASRRARFRTAPSPSMRPRPVRSGFKRQPVCGLTCGTSPRAEAHYGDQIIVECVSRNILSQREVSIPRQSRGLYEVSRSKRLYGVAHASPGCGSAVHLSRQPFLCPASHDSESDTLVGASVQCPFSRRAALFHLAAFGDDCRQRKCQTVTAAPAEPGELPGY